MILALLMAAEKTQPNNGFGIIIIPLMLVVFYFLLIRPQRKRMQQHQQLLGAIDVGDEVETIAGIIGTIRGMTDDEFLIEISPGTTVRMSRGAVRRKIYEPEPEEEEQESPDSNS